MALRRFPYFPSLATIIMRSFYPHLGQIASNLYLSELGIFVIMDQFPSICILCICVYTKTHEGDFPFILSPQCAPQVTLSLYVVNMVTDVLIFVFVTFFTFDSFRMKG